MTTYKVAAIIVTYNRKSILVDCIQALLKQSKPIDHIFIINNASTDGTLETLRDYHYHKNPLISVVTMKNNIGGAGGFFEGIKIAYDHGYDWLWLMDDDAEPEHDTLEKLFKKISSLSYNIKEYPIGICPRIINYQSRKPEYHQHKHLSYFFIEKNALVISLELIKIDANAFVGPLINRSCIKVCGLPYDKYFIWVDDVDYTYRISQLGTLLLDPDSIIYHKDTRPGRPVPKRRYFGQRNYTYFLTRTVMRYNKQKSKYFRIVFALLFQAYLSILYSLQYLKTGQYPFFENFLPIKGFIDGILNKFKNKV